MRIKDNCVLITGGASGIGKIMGRMVLEKGARMLIIWDINQAGIDAAVAELSAKGQVKGVRVDVSDYDNVKAAYASTVEACGEVDIVINCAGIITSNKTFDRVDVSEIDRTMRINTIAPMYVALQA